MLSKVKLTEYARLGAQERLKQIREEAQDIKAFLKINDEGTTDQANGEPSQAEETAPSTPTTRRRKRRMSAAARKAVSDRMRKYWAAKRAGKKHPKRG
jgi:hypothetical protein